jgi:hypothetical protein
LTDSRTVASAFGMHVVVAIGDIIASRQSTNRKALQTQLVATVATVNRSVRAASPGALLSPYTVTLGDEVQCVYGEPSNAIIDVIAFKARMQPHEMRFCIGLGELTTGLNKRAAIGMDGPAFYRAREGIDELKKDDSISLSVKAQHGIDVSLEDASVKLIDAAMQDWRLARFQILLALLNGDSVKKIARELDISATAVYKNISDGRLALLTEAAEATGRSLQRRLERLGSKD